MTDNNLNGEFHAAMQQRAERILGDPENAYTRRKHLADLFKQAIEGETNE